jgi:hypothetical protein
MSFTLTIQFVGECLFVPDQIFAGPGGGTMRVLLPQVIPSPTVPPHVAAVCFDAAYAQPDSPHLQGSIKVLQMDRWTLDLGMRGTSIDFSVPVNVAPIGVVARAPIVSSVFSDDPKRLLTARVDLRSGESAGPGATAPWNYPNEFLVRTTMELTNQLSWTMEMVSDVLDLAIFSLDGTLLSAIPLYRIGDSMLLQVYHTPAAELPPNDPPPPPLRPGTPADHFAAFYRVFENPLWEPLPTYAGDSQGAGPYTCMAAYSLPTATG